MLGYCAAVVAVTIVTSVTAIDAAILALPIMAHRDETETGTHGRTTRGNDTEADAASDGHMQLSFTCPRSERSVSF